LATGSVGDRVAARKLRERRGQLERSLGAIEGHIGAAGDALAAAEPAAAVLCRDAAASRLPTRN
jgi:hypothetical protein